MEFYTNGTLYKYKETFTNGNVLLKTLSHKYRFFTNDSGICINSMRILHKFDGDFAQIQ